MSGASNVVIYHSYCPDGWCAAWAVHKYFQDNGYTIPEFYAGIYGQVPPDIAGKDVIIVDFSYDRMTLAKIANDANTLVVLDHHKTAEEVLCGFEKEMHDAGNDVTIWFDTERSGAGITWDFYNESKRPWTVSYVEDRDLWRFDLPDSNYVDAYISALPFEFEAWYAAAAENIEDAIEKGKVIELKRKKYIDFVLSANTSLTKINDFVVPIVNCPQIDISHVLVELLLQSPDAPFVLGFSHRKDGMIQYSLRSRTGSGVDVSKIANQYGGGGHENAAGFQTQGLTHKFYG